MKYNLDCFAPEDPVMDHEFVVWRFHGTLMENACGHNTGEDGKPEADGSGCFKSRQAHRKAKK